APLRRAHDLDEPLGLADRDRPPEGAEGELPDLHLEALLAGGLLGEADASHGRVAERAGRDLRVVDLAVALARDRLDAGDPLGGPLVSEERPADHVADRVEVLRRRLEAGADLDERLRRLDLQVLEAEVLYVAADADRREDEVGLDRL